MFVYAHYSKIKKVEFKITYEQKQLTTHNQNIIQFICHTNNMTKIKITKKKRKSKKFNFNLILLRYLVTSFYIGFSRMNQCIIHIKENCRNLLGRLFKNTFFHICCHNNKQKEEFNLSTKWFSV